MARRSQLRGGLDRGVELKTPIFTALESTRMDETGSTWIEKRRPVSA